MDVGDDNAFFKYIWRFNAIAIAGIAVMSLLVGSFVASKLLDNDARERRPKSMAGAGMNLAADDKFVLGHPVVIAGSELVRVPLYRNPTYDMPASGKGDNNVVNFLFVNRHTGQSKWLVQATTQHFISDLMVSAKLQDAAEPAANVTGILYLVAELDTNGDGRLSDKDALTIAGSAADGLGYTKLIEGIDRLYSLRQIGDGKVMVLYQKEKVNSVEIYELPALKRVFQSAIPQLDLAVGNASANATQLAQ